MPLSGLLALIETLDHDQREEDGKLVHSYQCRKCAIVTSLNQFRIDLCNALKNLDESILDESQLTRLP